MRNLAIKYRPDGFEDVVHQGNVVKILTNQLKHREVKQGYLFTGGAGTGKTTVARIFAKAINEGEVNNIIEIDGASNNSVDNIRNIIEECRVKPLHSKYKVYIIDEVHMLSKGAFNALLKILEEPPATVIFILCTTDAQKIPTTIMSRVQRLEFKRIPVDNIVNRLEYIINKENTNGNNITYKIEGLELIARLSNGGMRDAITKLDMMTSYCNSITVSAVENCLGVSSSKTIAKIIKSIVVGDMEGVLNIIEQLYYDGHDLKQLVVDMRNYLLDITKITLTKIHPQYSEDTLMEMQSVVKVMNKRDIIELLDVVNELYYKLRYEHDVLGTVESELMIACGIR